MSSISNMEANSSMKDSEKTSNNNEGSRDSNDAAPPIAVLQEENVRKHTRPALRKNSVNQDGSRVNRSVSQSAVYPKPKKGMLDKISSGMIKNWRTRYFTLEEGVLTYFEPIKWYVKGQYDLYGLEFYEEAGDPPELIRMRGANRSDICLRCKDASSQKRWKAAIEEHMEYATAKGRISLVDRYSTADDVSFSPQDLNDPITAPVRFTASTPEPCFGWLRKKGQIFPSIKLRFFVLEEGILSYYKEDILEKLQQEREDQENDRVGSISRRLPKPLGKFSILGYDLFSDMKGGNIVLILSPGERSKSTRQLIIYPDDFQAREMWIKALTQHSLYSGLHK